MGLFPYASPQFCMINSHIDNPQIYFVCQSAYLFLKKFFGGIFFVLYSALLHLPPLDLIRLSQSAYHKSANSQIFHHGTERTKYIFYEVLPLFGLSMAKPPKISAQVFSTQLFLSYEFEFEHFMSVCL